MQKGFSLIEALLIIVVIGSAVFLMANIPNSMVLINKSKHLSLAREIATKEIEDKRAVRYENLVNSGAPISDSRLSLLPSGSGTVLVEDCDISICTSSEHIKKVSVTVTWVDNNKQQSTTLNTMIGEGGINQ